MFTIPQLFFIRLYPNTTAPKILAEVEAVKHIAKSLSFFNGNGDTLAHLLAIGRPGTNIVNSFSVIPLNEVKLLIPSVLTLANDSYGVYLSMCE